MKLDMGLTQIFVSYDYSIITRQDKPDRLLEDWLGAELVDRREQGVHLIKLSCDTSSLRKRLNQLCAIAPIQLVGSDN